MNPLTERYSDLLGEGADPALARLVADLDAVCAPQPLTFHRDDAGARTTKEQIKMNGTITFSPNSAPSLSLPPGHREPRRLSWAAVAVFVTVPVLLLAIVLVARGRTPSASLQPGIQPVTPLHPASATVAGLLPAPNRHTAAVASTGGVRTWQVSVGVDSPDHSIMAMGYLPTDLYIDVGDTVVWTSRSMEMHTVTFEPGMTPPSYSPGVVPPAGGPRYDGVSYATSGPMTAHPRPYYVDQTIPTYRLTFVKPGTFTYVDVLYHSLTGRIHVRPAGTPYPFTQAQVDAAATRQVTTSMAQGKALAAQAAHESNNLHVTLGIGNGHVSVNRFFPSHITVHVGDTVTFTNRDPINAHTVTFDSSQESDPTVTTDPSPATFSGGVLASGLLGTAPEFGPDNGKSYQVRFIKAGHYLVYCDLNDDLGMRASVDVLP